MFIGNNLKKKKRERQWKPLMWLLGSQCADDDSFGARRILCGARGAEKGFRRIKRRVVEQPAWSERKKKGGDPLDEGCASRGKLRSGTPGKERKVMSPGLLKGHQENMKR